ncbi:glycoside hydrolase family 30 protein [Cerasicoccus frondis]|uniref:glycoside hydrolase family 30 protein n=1 Tax=Cerasicoccus frondis TaxID=490090 RepID=UPI002852A7AD|nr:glycoside hydrolase family 30 protein [Cerasicoccus frondis]
MNKITSIVALSASTFLIPFGSHADVEIYQTTRQGDRLDKVEAVATGEASYTLTLDPSKTYQTLVGIGGSFTESSAQVISELSKTKRELALRSYFSPAGARYSLTRTHIASSDFSVTNYTYAPVPGDKDLEHFSIEPDRKYLLPMIKEAQGIAGADFKIMASPWTPPPWMKTNNHWNGGNLKREHYQTFADYMVKYIQAYAVEGIPIWGVTPANEPLGNGSQWESVHFSAHEMADYIGDYLGPTLAKHAPEVKIWAYDQNRGDHLVEWAETILGNRKAAKYTAGMAVHWYQSTIDYSAWSLDKVHEEFPDKQILHSEGCIDAVGDHEAIGSWLEDDWYWRAEATDWGYDWAAEDDKVNHPKYRPFYRYARDLIGGFNHHFVGWVDWNMFLNTRGGPNHARNYCLAPILVDSGKDEFYRTPLFYALAHFSRYMRPGAVRIDMVGHDEVLMATAFKNPDASIAIAVFNTSEEAINFDLQFMNRGKKTIMIPGQALQTILVKD